MTDIVERLRGQEPMELADRLLCADEIERLRAGAAELEEKLEKLKQAIAAGTIVTSDRADLVGGTWTFEIPAECKVGAGNYLLLSIPSIPALAAGEKP